MRWRRGCAVGGLYPGKVWHLLTQVGVGVTRIVHRHEFSLGDPQAVIPPILPLAKLEPPQFVSYYHHLYHLSSSCRVARQPHLLLLFYSSCALDILFFA